MKRINVTKPYLPPKSEYEKYLDKIWKNEFLTNNGPLHNEFEDSLKKYLDVKNVTLTVNGHSALDIAEKGLNISGEVITTPFTFVSTIHSLTLNGIKPVFCDIKETDLTIDEDKIESLITDKTTAILPVHVYGHMCNVEKIEKIAEKHNLKVIYDAAHTFGVKYKNKSLVDYGDVSILSFHATKLFNTIEGGALIYKNDNYKKTFNCLKNFGIEGVETIDYVGGNAKMNEFQAAMGLTNLSHIDELISKRKKLTQIYRDELKSVSGIKYFVPEKFYNNFVYNYSYFPILIDESKFGFDRNHLYDYLLSQGIFARKYFYPIITEIGCYKSEYINTNVEIAKKMSKQILCLPLYNGLKLTDIKRICDLIKGCQQNRR